MSKRKQSEYRRMLAESGDREMQYEAEREKSLEGIEVKYFEDDPNGDPDGDGCAWYCRWEGQDEWIELDVSSSQDQYNAEDAAIEARRQSIEEDWEARDEAEARAALDEDYFAGTSGP